MITVYTVVTNNYVDVMPQDYIPGFKYVCFTDGLVNVPEPFEEIILENIDVNDPTRLSRHPKINSHLYFPEDSITVYFDAREKLNNSSLIFCVNLLNNHDFISMSHQWRVTYSDDMIWLYLNGLLTENELINKTEKLLEENYNFSNHLCTYNGFIVRKNTDYVKCIEKKWWDEYLNFECYAKRDQIPLGIANTKIGTDKHLFMPKDFQWGTGESFNRNKSTDNKNFRPSMKDIARVQGYLTSTTNNPLLCQLIMSKPLSV